MSRKTVDDKVFLHFLLVIGWIRIRTTRLRTLKIMPRNLNRIVRSQSRLQDYQTQGEIKTGNDANSEYCDGAGCRR
jgi:hypothetical protein